MILYQPAAVCIQINKILNFQLVNQFLLCFFFDPLEERGKISKYMILRSTQVGFSKALFEVTGFVESESISEIVKNGLDNKSSFKALVEKNNTENTDISDNDVYIKYFYSEGCRSCLRFFKCYCSFS